MIRLVSPSRIFSHLSLSLRGTLYFVSTLFSLLHHPSLQGAKDRILHGLVLHSFDRVSDDMHCAYSIHLYFYRLRSVS